MKQDQVNNLKKLARYLYNLPDDYSHFDMRMYCRSDRWCYEIKDVSKETYSECGTVACALGHGIAAGVKPYESVEDWADYAIENFGLYFYRNDWLWCFSDSWSYVDNTPKGAAKRIMYMFYFGVPEFFDYDEDSYNKALLIYKDYTPVFED